MSIYRVFMKLMSKHLLFHLVLPLVVGLSVEILIKSWHEYPSVSNPFKYLMSWERFGFYAGILVAYLIIAGWLVNKEAKPPWRRVVPRTLDKVLKDANSFFATCTIPLKGWFDPYTQQYFSHIVKHQLAGGTLRHERVLLFFRNSDLDNARTPYLDGIYAKPLAMIHRNYGIKLGYLEPADIKKILADNSGCERDFAFITHEHSAETVVLFKKKGHLLKLRKLSNKKDVEMYRKLVDDIKKKVAGSETPTVELQPDDDHDFYNAVFPG